MSTGQNGERRRITVRDLLEMKQRGDRVVVLTAYDYLFARLVDECGADVVLVGDSLGHVFAGHDSTLPVTLDDMIYHCRAVRRGVRRALLVVDMPYMTFQVSVTETLRNAGRLIQDGCAEAVKLEGGHEDAAEHVHRLVQAGIPVMGHIGLTPQSVHGLGGYRVQGRDDDSAERLRAEAIRLEEAGAFAIVLELVPGVLAAEITNSVKIPTIGIGAGAHVDGQVLVLPDMLGLNETFTPKFVQRFAELADAARTGIRSYADAVRSGTFPDGEHTFE